jgi:hypothetical protein
MTGDEPSKNLRCSGQASLLRSWALRKSGGPLRFFECRSRAVVPETPKVPTVKTPSGSSAGWRSGVADVGIGIEGIGSLSACGCGGADMRDCSRVVNPRR